MHVFDFGRKVVRKKWIINEVINYNSHFESKSKTKNSWQLYKNIKCTHLTTLNNIICYLWHLSALKNIHRCVKIPTINLLLDETLIVISWKCFNNLITFADSQQKLLAKLDRIINSIVWHLFNLNLLFVGKNFIIVICGNTLDNILIAIFNQIQ